MAPDVTAARGRLKDSLRLTPGPLADAFAAHRQTAEQTVVGLYRRDPATWTRDPAVQKKVADRLGWMSSPELMSRSIDRLKQFAGDVVRDGVTDVVLLGMGGSSLAPEVLRAVLGVSAGWPRLHVLDTTDPAAVLAAATSPDQTLYLLASKSGTTIEPNSLAAHFQRRLQEAGVVQWARHFVAITDGGTELEARARRDGFRDIFINPSDIGGRYSALSFFGLVPAALMGQDLESLVNWGLAMIAAAEPGSAGALANPAVALGLAIGAAARAGRDKMTLVVPPSLEPFGLWVEQLIAESTGKNGVGVVPIAGEPLADSSRYGNDRLFVRVALRGSPVDAPAGLDAPRVDIDLPEPSALGAEFVRWEIATAVAGALLQINPFDEPNVQQAKDATRALLDRYKTDGRLPAPPADRATASGIALSLSDAARGASAPGDPEAFLTLLRAGDYFALLAYLGPDPALAVELHTLRRTVRDRARVATMLGYGPRYLHSTGQLHKGGANTGVFLLVTADPVTDVNIPGQPFSFGTLEHAQALGDFQSLGATGRRALHAHLPRPDAKLLRELGERLLARLG
jgi:transaldolase/glucose-6-phosphate isomerase